MCDICCNKLLTLHYVPLLQKMSSLYCLHYLRGPICEVCAKTFSNVKPDQQICLAKSHMDLLKKTHVLSLFVQKNTSKSLQRQEPRLPKPPPTISASLSLRPATTQTCPPARFIMPFHADQNCSCMENNLEHISLGAVIYKLFLRL